MSDDDQADVARQEFLNAIYTAACTYFALGAAAHDSGDFSEHRRCQEAHAQCAAAYQLAKHAPAIGHA